MNLETLTNYDATTWLYDTRQQLTRKQYADGKGTDYTHTPAGRLKTREWSRLNTGNLKLKTSYSYDSAGELTTTDYSDSTPDVTVVIDKIGRQQSVTNGVSRNTITYDPATLRPDYEIIAYDLNLDGTPDFTRVLDRSQDPLGRDTGFQLKSGSTIENQATYGYSATDGRLATVVGGGDVSSPLSFSYGYLPNSNLLQTVTGPIHTVTNTWEATRDVLDTKQNKVGSTIISSYDYAVNAIGQRTKVTTSGTAFPTLPTWAWAYDSLGQVTSADSSVSTSDRAYQYDAIGNRKKSDDSLTLPTSDKYISNALNQYTSRSVGVSPTLNPAYDEDGNATAYPLPASPTTLSTLIWDAENRLIEVKNAVGTTLEKNVFDSGSRKIATIANGVTTIYLYDAWNCIAEYTQSVPAVSAVLSKTRLWGMELGGTLQGAGGVGGLLSKTINNQPSTFNYFPTYDGNGNISEYLAADGSTAAHFEYDPFGNTVVNTDTNNQFAYRFSTKPLDQTTGLYYYGYRHYDPLTGRWPSRDPIGEKGGTNLYGFLRNYVAERIDVLGNWDWGWLQFIPIAGTAYAMIYVYPGENENDYNGEMDCEDCEDTTIAELDCEKKINTQLGEYLSDMANTNLAKLAVDLGAAGASAFAGPPSWIVGGILTIDGAAGAAAFANNASNMKTAATSAIESQCHCGPPS